MTLAVQFREAGADEPVFRPRTHVSLNGGRWFINGDVVFPGGRAEGLLMNVRMVNAVFEDAGRSDFDPGPDGGPEQLPDRINSNQFKSCRISGLTNAAFPLPVGTTTQPSGG
jgi:hypothetical protein